MIKNEFIHWQSQGLNFANKKSARKIYNIKKDIH